MRRVSVVGSSGSGKSTVSAAVSRAVGGPYIELDAIFHQPDWTQLPDEPFLGVVDERTRGERWVVDGNYSTVIDLVWSRSDTVVWLDLPRPVVMRQVVGRTLHRAATGQELWNGNREQWGEVFRMDPNRSIIRWAWTTHGRYVERYESRLAEPRWAHLSVVRLRSRAEVDAFLADLDPGPSPAARQ